MSLAHHRDYFEARRRECLIKADSAADPAIALLHRAFATHYERSLAASNTAHQQQNRPR